MAKIWPTTGHPYPRWMPPHPSPQQVLHIVMNAELVNHLRLKAGRQQTSISALLREMVKRDIDNEKRAKLKREGR